MQSRPDNATKYPPLARVLHWCSAAVILWALGSGLTLAGSDLEPGLRAALVNFNVAITTLFTPVFLLRIAHAWRMPALAPLPVSARARRGARLGHTALYAVTSIVLLSGALMLNGPLDLFGIATLPGLPLDGDRAVWFGAVHRISCLGLTALLVIHLLAVVWHEYHGRRVLRRMV